MNDLLPPSLRRILQETPNLAGAHLVGGCVRDWLLGIAPKDFDVEVYGLPWDRLVRTLSRWGRVDQVGKSFGVIKLTVGPGKPMTSACPVVIRRWLRDTADSPSSSPRIFLLPKPPRAAISPSTP